MIAKIVLVFSLILAFPWMVVGQDNSADVPEIVGAWMNAGHPQRSMIQSIGVRFDRNASALVRPGSLTVRHIETGDLMDLSSATLIYDPRNNSANWMISRDTGALLADGNYIAWITVSSLVDNLHTACAASSIPLDDFTFGFHQFTGDTDGDRDVDFRDSSVLRETWERNVNHESYHSFLDFDLSDFVDQTDRSEVETTYFSLLEKAPAIHLYLRQDTGENSSDQATSIYAFGFGSVDTQDAVTWSVRLGNGESIDITGLVTGGSGILEELLIDEVNGGALSVGNHQLTISAMNAGGDVIASDALDFEYLGDVSCGPYFITTPPAGVALGRVQSAEPLNLSKWTVEQWPGSQGAAEWVIAPDGLSVEQTRNSQPSALISDQSFLNLRVTGTFRVDTSGDDDLMGFIFGYQNSSQFYVFDWKQNSQGFVGGTAVRGMSIKRIDAQVDFTEADFWWSDLDRENTTVLVPPNEIPWEDFQDYEITLDFTPGRISVEVREEGELLDRLEVEDDTFTGGRFGFYNYSQDSVIYSGFTQEALNNVYFYDSEAVDPDGDSVTYALAPNPDGSEPPVGATVNAVNGSLIWQPSTAGTFPFTLVAEDSDGLTDTQHFDVMVSPIDEPPTVYISKTSPSVFPGEEVAIRVVATDDQQIFRTRLFIDDVEAELDSGGAVITSFESLGVVELRAIAIDSAEQVSEITSYIRVLDPNAPPTENPNQTVVAPPGQTTGDPTDRRPLVSFQSPLTTSDDPTQFIGTVDSNGGTLDRWYLEWAPLANVDSTNLASPAVLWQTIVEDTTAPDASELATIDPESFPDESIVFRLRAQNVNGLGAMASVVLNPRTQATSGPTEETGTGDGTRATAAFTSPLDPSDDYTLLRGTVQANGGSLQSWALDYAPRNQVNLNNLADPSVTWTPLEQGTNELEDELMATLDPAILPNDTFVFRLIAVNTSSLGSVATLIYNPVATNLSGPGDITGIDSASGQRPVTRITSPTDASHDRTALVGSVRANGGTLEKWIVDYAPYNAVNLNDLGDASVAWTSLGEGEEEVANETLVALTDPVFQNGIWVIRLRAFNTNGLGSLASTVLDTGDASVPDVAITSPDAESSIGFLTDVRGTVNSGGGVLDFWKLEIAPSEEVALTNLNSNSANWVELGTGSSAMNDEVLGSLDPTQLRNGSYILRLRAFNSNGRGLTDGRLIHVSGEAKLGNFRLEFDDLVVPLAGIPIRIQRIYDTLNANRSGDFGYGWTLGLGDPDIRETVPDTGDSYFFATPFEIGTRVFLTTPEGKRVGFTFNVRNPRNRFLFVDYEPYFEPDPGVYETLTIAPVDFERVEVDAEGAVYTPLLPFGYNPDRYRLTTREGIVYDYDQRYGLQKVTDRNGQSVSFSRDGLTHTSGERVAFERDSAGRITSITAPDGASLVYSYDSFGDLTSVVDPLGGRTTFAYLRNPAHYLEKVANPTDAAAGLFTRRIVYENGRIARIEDADGNPLGVQNFDPDSFMGTITDAEGNVTTVFYNDRGNIIRRVSPEGAVTEYEYEDPFNPDLETARVDPNGARYTDRYDRSGNPIEHTTPAGLRIENEYNDLNQLTVVRIYDATGALHLSESNEYDDKGNLTRSTRTDGATMDLLYDDSGRPIRFSNYDGSTIEFAYSEQSRIPIEVRYDTGKVISVTRDRADRPIQIEDDLGMKEMRSYDASGRLIRTEIEGGTTKDITYDADGNVASTTDSIGRTVHYAYNSDGEILRQTFSSRPGPPEEDDPTVEYERDLNGRIIALTDPNGNRTSYMYDGDGNVLTMTDPLGNTVFYEYDATGLLIAITDRRGLKRTFTYNGCCSEMLSETWYDINGEVVKTIEREFDDFGRLTTISDGQSSYAFTHDSLGQVTSVSNAGTPGVPEVVLSYAHGATGVHRRVWDDSGTSVNYDYENGQVLASAEWIMGAETVGSVQFDHNSRGFIEATTRRSGAFTSGIISQSLANYSGEFGRLESMRHIDGNADLLGAEAESLYEYNSAGQIVAKTRGNRTLDYTYDGLGQIAGVEERTSGDLIESYAYDAAGNRTASHLLGAHLIGEGNRLLSNDTYDYEYDLDGNVTVRTHRDNGTRTVLEWDHRNRNTRIIEENSDGEILSESVFVYDAFDRIITKTIDGISTSTVWEGFHPWVEYSSSGEAINRYLFGNGIDSTLASWKPFIGVTWYLSDLNGTVDYELGEDGSVVSVYSHDSFGNMIAGESPEFGFTGRTMQTTEFINFRSRLLDPLTGRFLSQDAIGFSSGDWNLYRYAHNSPLKARDPFGTENLGSVTSAMGQIATFAKSVITVGGAAALKFAKKAFLYGVKIFIVTEIIDWVLSDSICTNEKVIELRKTSENLSKAGVKKIGVKAAEGVLHHIAAPLGHLLHFISGVFISSLKVAYERTKECVSELIEMGARYAATLREYGVDTADEFRPSIY